jgi:four helix bundle protein
MDMTVCVYDLTRTFPNDELYGLTSQLRRASVSVASNIAEGRGRMTDGEFRQFLGIAQGSTYEVQTQLLVARQLLIRPLNSVEVSHPFRKKRGKDGARGQYLWAESIKMGDENLRRKAEALCTETSKMLGAFILSLEAKS